MIAVTLTGEPQAHATLSRHAEASAVIGRWRVIVGANTPYARFVHEGTRRMRGRPFLAQALAATRPNVARRIAQATPRGASAVEQALTATEREIAAAARRNAPVRTGRLRASIFTKIGGRA